MGVSIPYRYKQNRLTSLKNNKQLIVSIPYRYKQNDIINGVGLAASILFQSPIGTNKTEDYIISSGEYERFQSPIGTNKTAYRREREIA